MAPSLSASTAARVVVDFEARRMMVVLLRRPPVTEARFAPTKVAAGELRAKDMARGVFETVRVDAP